MTALLATWLALAPSLADADDAPPPAPRCAIVARAPAELLCPGDAVTHGCACVSRAHVDACEACLAAQAATSPAVDDAETPDGPSWYTVTSCGLAGLALGVLLGALAR